MPIWPGPLPPPVRIDHSLEAPQTGHFSITDCVRVSVVRIQNSTVKSFVSKLPIELPNDTESSTPSKLKACPTTPPAKVGRPLKTPLLGPIISLVLPSAGHQLTGVVN